jgi:hypothetical protein
MTESSLPLQFPVWASGRIQSVIRRTCRCDVDHERRIEKRALRRSNQAAWLIGFSRNHCSMDLLDGLRGDLLRRFSLLRNLIWSDIRFGKEFSVCVGCLGSKLERFGGTSWVD